MQEWRGPYVAGTESRAFGKKQKNGLGRRFIVIPYKNCPPIQNGRACAPPAFWRSPNSFQMFSEKPCDKGKNWEGGDYSLAVTRADK